MTTVLQYKQVNGAFVPMTSTETRSLEKKMTDYTTYQVAVYDVKNFVDQHKDTYLASLAQQKIAAQAKIDAARDEARVENLAMFARMFCGASAPRTKKRGYYKN